MSNVLLKRCSSCREYTLAEVCPRCGAKAVPNRPAKYSPEDNYGEYRRKLKKLDASERSTGPAQPKPATPSAEPATRPAPKPGPKRA